MHIDVLVVDHTPFGPHLARTVVRRAACDGLDVRVGLVTSATGAMRPVHRPDVAFVALALPDGSGLDVIRAWRASPRLRCVCARIISDASIDAVAAECDLLDAPALSKRSPSLLGDVAARLFRQAASRPRSANDERRRFADTLASEAGLGRALHEVLLRRLANESHGQIARARGTTVTTAKRQSKLLASALERSGIDTGRNLTAALLCAMIEARYDE